MEIQTYYGALFSPAEDVLFYTYMVEEAAWLAGSDPS